MTNISAPATNVTLAPPTYYNNVYIERGVPVTGTGNAIYGADHSWFITNQGLVAGATGWGITLTHGGVVSNAASASITGGASGGQAGGISISGPFASVYNHGSIGSTTGIGIALAAYGTIDNARGGQISGSSAAIALSGAGGEITNRGVVTATGTWGVLADSRVYITNMLGATISSSYAAIGVYDGSGTVLNAGLIEATGSGSAFGVVLGKGGSLDNTLHGSILGGIDGVRGDGQPVSLSNQGSITGGSGSGGAGVALAAGGYLSNGAGGAIRGGVGLVIDGRPADVTNAGSIQGLSGAGIDLTGGGVVKNAVSGSIIGAAGGVRGGGYGSIVNGGYIGGGSSYGVYLAFGGSVTNDAGAVITGAAGVDIARAAATIINDGTIIGSSADGVRITGGGTVVDAGTIAGAGVAVYLGGFGPDTLVIDPGAVFDGSVVAATTGQSYLDLGAGGPASISGLGTQFTGFTSVQADRGSDWTFQGSNAVGQLIIDGTAEVAGGSLSATGALSGRGTLVADSGSTVTIGQDSTWSGTIDLSHAALSLAGSVHGSGTFDIGAQGSLTVQGGAGSHIGVAFTGATGSLDLGDAAGFHAAISGFGPGSTIDLLATAADAAVFSAGTLTVSEGTATVARLDFAGSYASNAFKLSGDGHAGTFITLHA